MEALLRQSRSMCPFLQKTSPATLRSLSTTTTTRHVSPGGGTMSNLQVLARRCPVMGKALAVQMAKTKAGTCGLGGTFGGTRAYKSKAHLHTSRVQNASIAGDVLRRHEDGWLITVDNPKYKLTLLQHHHCNPRTHPPARRMLLLRLQGPNLLLPQQPSLAMKISIMLSLRRNTRINLTATSIISID